MIFWTALKAADEFSHSLRMRNRPLAMTLLRILAGGYFFARCDRGKILAYCAEKHSPGSGWGFRLSFSTSGRANQISACLRTIQKQNSTRWKNWRNELVSQRLWPSPQIKGISMKTVTFVASVVFAGFLSTAAFAASKPAASTTTAPAAASTATAPAAASTTVKKTTPTKSPEKTAISKQCSVLADAKGLHGKDREKFRAECKKNGGKAPK
ncbi:MULTISPECIES: hypothetical protein [Phyllobacteriaceae]|nr:hypothetical protein [Mesorhizobium sp. YL-MeA3-2017]MDQ0330201.1 hypothetical protein [Mesorhizobium sp. YL-MeA3-2017]